MITRSITFKTLCIILPLCAAAIITAGASRTANAQGPQPLYWQIGAVDKNDSEFALAPSKWSSYKADALYVIGSSNPATDWPYVQPGPDDQWAGGRAHTNSIYFGLANVIAEGDCKLTLSLLDAQKPYSPTLQITVNGQSWTKQTVPGGGDLSINGQPDKGIPSTVSIDFPSSLLRKGVNTVTITTTQGSWILYDAVTMNGPAEDVLMSLPQFAQIQSAEWLHDVLALKDGAYQQVLDITTVNTGAVRTGVVQVSGEPDRTINVPSGKSTIELLYPESSKLQKTTVSLKSAGIDYKVYADRVPCKRYTIFEIEQSHMDIGYAYLQQKTLDIHSQDITDAFAQFAKTAGYPSDDRFRWNCESLIETDEWLRQATPAQIVQFQHAVRNGDLGLAALYCNELTGLCRPEELAALLADANKLRNKYDIPIDSAMISDVPGYTWGMVSMLAESGIKYFSWGPNPGDHLGSARDFDNQAFYWLSPSGKDKVLVWQSNNGYQPAFNDNDQSLKDYLNSFDQRFPNDPYDMIYDRHTINDNGPIDPDLPAFVRQWNDKYAYPHLVITTNSHMFHEFEAKYGKTLKTVRGDFTGYWEDGAASSAAETAINRRSAELTAQDDILWSMIAPTSYPHPLLDDAWKNAVLYDEHTWGAYDSWTNPESDFDRAQWAWKRQYALNTQLDANKLEKSAIARVKPGTAIAVFNTLNWPRTDLVTISAIQSAVGDVVKDEAGKPVPSQRLHDGTLVFIASNVPAFSSVKYRVVAGKSVARGNAGVLSALNQLSGSNAVPENVLMAGQQNITVAPETGCISAWAVGPRKTGGIDSGDNLVNLKDPTCRGLNDYLYVLGDDNSAVSYATVAKTTILDGGPLLAAVRVDSSAPGCNSLARTYTVVSGLNKIWMTDTLDKQQVHQNEGVHIGFNFNVPNGVVRMDMPWSVVRPDLDQTPHANKTVYPVGRWCDVSNGQYGVTCANLDNPMMEVGAITQARENNGGWLETAKKGSTIYWQVMNNYWHTNYKAYQSGVVSFRYVLTAHKGFDQAAAQHFGIEQSQPMIAVPVAANSNDYKLPLTISNDAVLVTACHPSADGKGWLVRLFNGSNKPQALKVGWTGASRLTIYRTDLWGNQKTKTQSTLILSPMEIESLCLTP